MTALSSLQQRNRRLTCYQPHFSLLLVFSTDDLACVHSYISHSAPPQCQRHVSSLQLLGVHTHSALIAPPHCHMIILIQVDTVLFIKPPDLHGNSTGFRREVTGQSDITTTRSLHNMIRGDQFKICRGTGSCVNDFHTHIHSLSQTHTQTHTHTHTHTNTDTHTHTHTHTTHTQHTPHTTHINMPGTESTS